jgi:sugar (pentulose or hexulose) kinase
MILWNDTRAMGYAERLQEMQPPSFWQQHTLRVFAPAGLARLLWLRETRPELFTPEIIHAGAGEFLYFHLTGVWRQDTGHAIQVTGYNGIEQQVPAALLELADLPPSLFAPIRDGHTTVPLSKAAAERYGLPEGIPVAGPYFDQEAGYLAAAGEGRKPLQCSLGTAWVGNFTLPIGNWTGSPFQLAVSAPGGEGLLIVQPLLTGNAGWDWALREFIGSSSGQALARAAAFFQERLLPLEGLVAIPWFTQPNPLLPDRVGGGVYIGMNTRTDRSDLLRAVAAGMTFELRRVLGQIADSGHLDCLVLSGGAAKGWYFAQLIAALFAPLPVFCEERAGSATAQGALYAFGPDAVKTPLQRVETAEPAAIHAIKRACNDYVSVFERLYGGQFQGRPFAL